MKFFTDPVCHQFERAWENARTNNPSRCTRQFIEKWFGMLQQQGVVVNFSVVESNLDDGFFVSWEAPGGGWKFFHAEAP